MNVRAQLIIAGFGLVIIGAYLLMNDHPLAGGWIIFAGILCILEDK